MNLNVPCGVQQVLTERRWQVRSSHLLQNIVLASRVRTQVVVSGIDAIASHTLHIRYCVTYIRSHYVFILCETDACRHLLTLWTAIYGILRHIPRDTNSYEHIPLYPCCFSFQNSSWARSLSFSIQSWFTTLLRLGKIDTDLQLFVQGNYMCASTLSHGISRNEMFRCSKLSQKLAMFLSLIA
jgi:hypothetical protein